MNCCWKSKWLSLFKKTFTNVGHIDAKLIDFSEICQKKTPAKLVVFYWLFLGEVFPRNFPWNWAIFLKICLWKSFENFLRILTFFPRKIPRNRPIFPRICLCKSREILLFFPRNIRSPGNLNSSKNFTCPLGKLRTEFTSPLVKSTSHYFLCTLVSIQ